MYKIINKIPPEEKNTVIDVVINESVLSDMQILLAVRHNVLLRCVFESILTLFEWVQQIDPVINVSPYFCNSYTIDKLITCVEQFSEEFKTLATEVLTYLFRLN